MLFQSSAAYSSWAKDKGLDCLEVLFIKDLSEFLFH